MIRTQTPAVVVQHATGYSCATRQIYRFQVAVSLANPHFSPLARTLRRPRYNRLRAFLRLRSRCVTSGLIAWSRLRASYLPPCTLLARDRRPSSSRPSPHSRLPSQHLWCPGHLATLLLRSLVRLNWPCTFHGYSFSTRDRLKGDIRWKPLCLPLLALALRLWSRYAEARPTPTSVTPVAEPSGRPPSPIHTRLARRRLKPICGPPITLLRWGAPKAPLEPCLTRMALPRVPSP